MRGEGIKSDLRRYLIEVVARLACGKFVLLMWLTRDIKYTLGFTFKLVLGTYVPRSRDILPFQMGVKNEIT